MNQRKYLFPMDKAVKKQIQPLSKPYPKDPQKVTYKEFKQQKDNDK